jgi:hypothetical protein
MTTNKRRVHIFGGGTYSHVRAHLALCAPAFGTAAFQLHGMFSRTERWGPDGVRMHLTRMADPKSALVTNEEVANRLEQVLQDPGTQVVVFNAALCDFNGQINGLPSSARAKRLESRDGPQLMELTPAEKIIGRIRATRKDVFAVGFKTTSGASSDLQYMKGLRLLKDNSLNLVLANDLVTRNNMVIAPEETRYRETTNRISALQGLVELVEMRAGLTFTRSTVVPGPGLPWDGGVPKALKAAVDGLIQAGAYKPFLGKTVGHFAFRMPDGQTIATSRRKSDFNRLEQDGMVLIQSCGANEVLARGGKPSVGGQSQRIIFSEHPSLDCIVHAHAPLRQGHERIISVRPQEPFECGSHECGQNTSSGLAEVEKGLWAVHLDQHGFNVVFDSSRVSGSKVLEFIDRHWNLSSKTGGPVLPEFAQ